MPEYLSPGVYVEEVPAGPVPIQGVSTSTTGMVGQTERGPLGARLVTSWLDYQRRYGGLVMPGSYLPWAVRGFFDNGGRRLYLSRVAADGEPASRTTDDLTISAVGPGNWGGRVFARIGPPTQRGLTGFRLTLLYWSPGRAPDSPLAVDPLDVDAMQAVQPPEARPHVPDVVEDFENVSVEVGSPFHFGSVVNGASSLVTLSGAPTAPPAPSAEYVALDVEEGDETTPLTPDRYEGVGATLQGSEIAPATGLRALEAIDDISLVAVPDHVNPQALDDPGGGVTNLVVSQCERLKDRFAVLAVEANQLEANTIITRLPTSSSYAAIYYPWVRVVDPATGDTLKLPPHGHVLGVYARTDEARGVHKAPANEEVLGLLTRDLPTGEKPLEVTVDKGRHDILNPAGVCVIRDFRPSGRAIRIWGARTLSANPQWRYVNVRRLFIFLEKSIDRGTQWVVFEGNYESTWARVTRSVANFLTSVWRDGALMGLTPEEAFFVRCDRTTMTPDDIDNGRLICLIGVAPVKPAEFVIFRLSQKTIEAQS
jgi:uncharacterized protein